MKDINIPAKFHSFSINFDGSSYAAVVYYQTGKISSVASIRPDKRWGDFDGAKKWVEEITGIEIK